MKSMLKSVLLVALIACAGVASAADPVIGTWQINLAKSKFSPGPAPKSDTRTYAATADGTSMTWKVTTADGKDMVVQSTFKTDGKDYSITGTPNFDTLTLKQVDANKVESQQKLGGKVIGKTTRTVSDDGKVLTLKSKGTGADGKAYENEQVYDRM